MKWAAFSRHQYWFYFFPPRTSWATKIKHSFVYKISDLDQRGLPFYSFSVSLISVSDSWLFICSSISSSVLVALLLSFVCIFVSLCLCPFTFPMPFTPYPCAKPNHPSPHCLITHPFSWSLSAHYPSLHPGICELHPKTWWVLHSSHRLPQMANTGSLAEIVFLQFLFSFCPSPVP